MVALFLIVLAQNIEGTEKVPIQTESIIQSVVGAQYFAPAPSNANSDNTIGENRYSMMMNEYKRRYGRDTQ